MTQRTKLQKGSSHGVTECVKCQSRDIKVKETRRNTDGIYRRRECERCGHRSTTQEFSEETFRALQDRQAVKFCDHWIGAFIALVKKLIATGEDQRQVFRKAWEMLQQAEDELEREARVNAGQ